MKSLVCSSLFSRWFLIGGLSLLIAVSLPLTAWSQAASGNIEGFVYDASGAVVPGVTVRVVNPATGLTRTVTTNEQGHYAVLNLPVGAYELTFMKEGFTELKRTGVVLTVGSALKVDATLEVAGVREQVVVTEAAPILELSRHGQATVIDAKVLQEIPVNNRNWQELVLLTPGVVIDGEFDAAASVSFGGIEGVFNNVQVDGADNNNAFFAEMRGRTRAPFQFSQETVQEFRVSNSNFSAEFGRSAGGVVNAITKSGTNDFHGSAFWYIRDSELNAAPFFTNAAGLPKPDTRRQQFGGTLGGPLKKDRLFFFFNYEQQERNDPVTVVLPPDIQTEMGFNPLNFFTICSVAAPCATGANGFLDGVDGAGSTNIDRIDNPPGQGPSIATENAIIHQAFLNWAFARALFLGDASFLDRTFATPVGTVTTINPFPGRSFSNIQRTGPRHPDQIVFFPKITWLLNPNNTLNLQWNFQRFTTKPNGIQTNETTDDNFTADAPLENRSNSWVASLASVIRPTLVNEFRYQFGRDREDVGTNAPGTTGISFQGFRLGSRTSNPRFLREDRHQFQNNTTWISGPHQLKFGLDIIRTRDDNFFPGSFNGSYSFSSAGEFIESARDFIRELTGSTAAGQAYFGVGCQTVGCTPTAGPRSITSPSFLVSYNQRFGGALANQTTVDYGVYVQDNIRLRPTLTLNLGLRYEFQQLEDPIFSNTLIPQTGRINQDGNNFAPRVGIAWQMRDKVVLRAGYGIFYIRTAQLDVNNALTNNNAFSFNQFLSGGTLDFLNLLFNPVDLDPLFPQVPPALTVPTTACPDPSACEDPFASVSFFASDRVNGYAQQGNLEIQWEFMPESSFSAAYLVTKGTNLPRNRNLNVLGRDFALANARLARVEDLNGGPDFFILVPDYAADDVPFPFTTRLNVPDGRFRSLFANESAADSIYHALALQLQRRFRQGLTFGVSYTLSKTIDTIGNGFSSSGTFFSDLFDQNDPSLDRGLSRLDQRQTFVAHAIWDVPFWKNTEGGRRWLLDGWTLGGIYTAFSGRAFTPVVDDDINRDNSTTAFGDGDRVPFLARGTFTTPGRNNLDLSVYKSFRWAERYQLQFRAQFFNAFNRPTFIRFNQVLYQSAEGDDPDTPGVVEDLVFTLNRNAATGELEFLKPELARRSRDIQLGLVFRF